MSSMMIYIRNDDEPELIKLGQGRTVERKGQIPMMRDVLS